MSPMLIRLIRLVGSSLLLCLLPNLAAAQTAVSSYMNLGALAPTSSAIASPSAPGTVLSTAVANTGMIGSGINWTTVAGTAANMTVGPHQPGCNLGAPILVGGTTYTGATPSQSYQYSDANSFTDLRGSISGGANSKVSVGFCLISGISPTGTGTHNDRLQIYNGNGHLIVVQQCPGTVGSGCGGYIIHLEVTSPSGSGVSFSGSITIKQNVAYWVTAQVDWSIGLAKMNVYLASYPFTQIGSTVSVSTFTESSNPASIRLGNDEAWTSATTSFFENLILDTANATFPLGVGTLATPWAGIISPSRAIDWSSAGVTSGIPARSTICNTLSPGATTSQINTALTGCPTGQTVQLNAGTFSGLGTLFIPNNITLRGQGADQTFLVFTGGSGCHGASAVICMESTDNNIKGTPSNLVNWTAGYLPGATIITLASVPNLVIGNQIILDQLDDDVTGCDVGGVLVTQITGTCTGTAPGSNGPFATQGNLGGSQRNANGGTRQQEQIVTVTGCNGSSTPGTACSGTSVPVTISPGLYMPNWRAGQTPMAWWATSPGTGMGVESLSIDVSGASGQQGIEMFNINNSWVKGVREIDPTRAHVQLFHSNHNTIRDSYFFITQGAGQTGNYGIDCFGGDDNLIENNIFHAIVGPMEFNSSCNGNVLGYNFTINDYYTVSPLWSNDAQTAHTSGTNFDLMEGNRLHANFVADVIHGTKNFLTYFRNEATGTNVNCYSSGSTYATSTYGTCNNNLIPIRFYSFNRFFNLIANVLGQTGVQNSYQSGTQPLIIDLGTGNSPVVGDSIVKPTLANYGNYNTVDATVRWCGNSTNTGWATTCASTSEMPLSLSTNVQSQFATPEPSVGDTAVGQIALPASFYLSAKPSFFAAAKPFPPIGPDVSGGNLANLAGHAYSIPAEDCWTGAMGGSANGNEGALSFNAATCYSGATSSISFNPNPLDFGNQRQGVKSVAGAITVTNSGTTTLTLSTPYFTLSGLNVADFTNTGAGTCANGLSLLAGQSCTITLTFTPTTLSSEVASILINATISGSVSLTGIGVTTSLSPHIFALTYNKRSKDGR